MKIWGRFVFLAIVECSICIADHRLDWKSDRNTSPEFVTVSKLKNKPEALVDIIRYPQPQTHPQPQMHPQTDPQLYYQPQLYSQMQRYPQMQQYPQMQLYPPMQQYPQLHPEYQSYIQPQSQLPLQSYFQSHPQPIAQMQPQSPTRPQTQPQSRSPKRITYYAVLPEVQNYPSRAKYMQPPLASQPPQMLPLAAAQSHQALQLISHQPDHVSRVQSAIVETNYPPPAPTIIETKKNDNSNVGSLPTHYPSRHNRFPISGSVGGVPPRIISSTETPYGVYRESRPQFSPIVKPTILQTVLDKTTSKTLLELNRFSTHQFLNDAEKFVGLDTTKAPPVHQPNVKLSHSSVSDWLNSEPEESEAESEADAEASDQTKDTRPDAGSATEDYVRD